MKTHLFKKQSEMDAPPDRVFAFHERPDALVKLTPPGTRVEVLERTNGLQVGSRVILNFRVGPLRRTWIAEHTEYEPGRMFADRQLSGPFRHWYHRHIFEPTARGTTLMIDEIEYAAPFGWFGSLFRPLIESRLKRLFDYRHEVVKREIEAG